VCVEDATSALQSWFWDGTVESDRVNVRIPIESATAKGTLYGAAVLTGGRWEVIGLEMRFEHVSEAILKEATSDELVSLPKEASAFPEFKYDLVGRRWMPARFDHHLQAMAKHVQKHSATER
jgi:hypothetical protein